MILACKSARVFNMRIHVLSSCRNVHVIKRKAVNSNPVDSVQKLAALSMFSLKLLVES